VISLLACWVLLAKRVSSLGKSSAYIEQKIFKERLDLQEIFINTRINEAVQYFLGKSCSSCSTRNSKSDKRLENVHERRKNIVSGSASKKIVLFSALLLKLIFEEWSKKYFQFSNNSNFFLIFSVSEYNISY